MNPCSAELRIYFDLYEAQSKKRGSDNGTASVSRLVVDCECIYLLREVSLMRQNANEGVIHSF